MGDFSDFMRSENGEKENRNFTEKSGNKKPWQIEKKAGDTNGDSGLLDLISGGKYGRTIPGAKTPQPKTTEELLELKKKEVARCMGSARGAPKSFRTADMKVIQHQIAMKRKRGGFYL